ncbi:hypothetical protein V5738_14245 [Salinisphaera sp. SPP-AMP-43]|uniref:hypothetical protein n=1 Tax=Salinisphaera sp. SPP-AMP-43 TaxID=3121288 RepID=UPI003C6E1177
MTIREARDSDTPSIVKLWERCALAHSWHDPYRDIQRTRHEPSTWLFVATQLRQIIGTIMVGCDGRRGWL